MNFKLQYGEDFDENYLKRIMEIDEIVYEEDGYVGELKNMVARYLVDPRQFVCIEDTESGRLAGYINFIPCTKALYEDIRYQSEHIRDDDIRPQELEPLKQTGNDLFIISIALHPDFKDTDAIKDLSNGWIDYLNRLETSGYPITSITATAVSPDGRKALHRMQFEQERILREDGNIVYVCEGQNLQKLKKKELRLHGQLRK